MTDLAVALDWAGPRLADVDEETLTLEVASVERVPDGLRTRFSVNPKASAPTSGRRTTQNSKNQGASVKQARKYSHQHVVSGTAVEITRSVALAKLFLCFRL